MTPYFTNGAQTIYCGDARSFGSLPPMDLTLLDPPGGFDVDVPKCPKAILFGAPVREEMLATAGNAPQSIALWMPKLPLRTLARMGGKHLMVPVWFWGMNAPKPLYEDPINPEDGAEKPLSMLEGLLHGAASVLDPFMGTGNSLLVCKRMGIPAVGIDIDEAKCRAAKEKLEAA